MLMMSLTGSTSREEFHETDFLSSQVSSSSRHPGRDASLSTSTTTHFLGAKPGQLLARVFFLLVRCDTVATWGLGVRGRRVLYGYSKI